MSDEHTYFRYIVAQYVHSRREERLNVGVVVHDPLRSAVRSQFDTKTVTRRIKTAFPDVDARGLRLFLQDLSEAVMSHAPLNATLDKPDALSEFGTTWRNAIQFTPVRSLPAPNIAAAVDILARLYVTDIPVELHQTPAARGIPYAKERTRLALKKVLQLEQGLNYGEFKEERIVTHQGRSHRIPIEFPFYVYDQFVIDTISFKSDSFPRKLDVAAGFMDKVDWLNRQYPGMLIPCLTFVPDEDKRDETDALVAQILEKTALPDAAVVEVERSEELAAYIGRRHQAA